MFSMIRKLISLLTLASTLIMALKQLKGVIDGYRKKSDKKSSQRSS